MGESVTQAGTPMLKEGKKIKKTIPQWMVATCYIQRKTDNGNLLFRHLLVADRGGTLLLPELDEDERQLLIFYCCVGQKLIYF